MLALTGVTKRMHLAGLKKVVSYSRLLLTKHHQDLEILVSR